MVFGRGTIRSTSAASRPANPMRSSVLPTLKMVWAFAIWRGTSAARRAASESSGAPGDTERTRSANGGMNHTTSRTPTMLNTTWTTAALTASRGLPIAESPAVTQVPMFAPRSRAIPCSRVSRPWVESTMTSPAVAAEDWTTAVNANPARIPSQGARVSCMKAMKGSCDRSGAIASPIMSMPKNRSPIPIITMP